MTSVSANSSDIAQLLDQLETAGANFTKNFRALDEEITTLTSRGFTGEAAQALEQTYTQKVQPVLKEISNETEKKASYMAEQKQGFERLTSNLDSTMRR